MLKTDWLREPHSCSGWERFEVVSHIERLPIIHHTEYFYVKTSKRYALCNMTRFVEEAIQRAKVQDGLCFVSAMHITAGVYINDAESGLLQDISLWLEALAPYGKNYQHHKTGEDNADAHLKSYLTNHALTAPITQGKLDFGTWQQIFYAEFDGLRTKRIFVKVMGLV